MSGFVLLVTSRPLACSATISWARDPGPFSQNSFDTRIDYAASPTVSVFGRFSLDYFKLSGKGVLARAWGQYPGSGLLMGFVRQLSITPQLQFGDRLHQDYQRNSLLTDCPLVGWFKYNPQTQKSRTAVHSDDRVWNSQCEHQRPKDSWLGCESLVGNADNSVTEKWRAPEQ